MIFLEINFTFDFILSINLILHLFKNRFTNFKWLLCQIIFVCFLIFFICFLFITFLRLLCFKTLSYNKKNEILKYVEKIREF